MITTRFIGRLGNSMFQLAAAIGYAKRYGYEWAAPVDARESSIHKVFPDLPKTASQPRNYPKGGYDPQYYDYFSIPDMGPELLLAGFFQSLKFFEHCQDDVKKVFQLDHYQQYEGYISLHVRRGDYVQYANSFPPITKEYVTEALTKVPTANVKGVLVFSDDIEFCKSQWGDQFEYFDDLDERRSLSAMASCSHHIIANSSFSWWGAYLGHNPDKTIVCPHNESWYGQSNGVVEYARLKGIEPCKDLIPDNWIKIKFR